MSARRRRTPPTSVLASAAVALLAACQGDTPIPTAPIAPTATGAQLVRAVGSTPGICLTAAQSPNGGYLVKQITIKLSPADARSGQLARFAYRGWAADASEPVRLAVCSIPDTPDARDRFAQVFGASVVGVAQLRARARAAGMAGADAWAPGALSPTLRGTPATYVVDGLVADPRVNKLAAGAVVATSTMASACAPTAIQCVEMTDPYCDPYAIVPDPACSEVSEEPQDPNSPPPDELQPGTTLDPYNDAASLAAATYYYSCTLIAYSPKANTAPAGNSFISSRHFANCFAGDVLQFKVSGNIQRRRIFFGWLPWWIVVASSAAPIHDGLGSAASDSSIGCLVSAYYRANTILKVTTPGYTESNVVTSPNKHISC